MSGTDHDLFQLFAEYSGRPEDWVRQLAQNYRGINEQQWAECPGETWEERALEFYDRADGYVFDLIHSNKSKANLIEIYLRRLPKVLFVEVREGADASVLAGGGADGARRRGLCVDWASYKWKSLRAVFATLAEAGDEPAWSTTLARALSPPA